MQPKSGPYEQARIQRAVAVAIHPPEFVRNCRCHMDGDEIRLGITRKTSSCCRCYPTFRAAAKWRSGGISPHSVRCTVSIQEFLHNACSLYRPTISSC